jgi:hypothetical protein
MNEVTTTGRWAVNQMVRNEVRNWSTEPVRMRQVAPGAWWCSPEQTGHAGYVVSAEAGFPVHLLIDLDQVESVEAAPGHTLYIFDDDTEWALLEAQSETLVAETGDERFDLASTAFRQLELRAHGAALRRAFPRITDYRLYVARVAAQQQVAA